MAQYSLYLPLTFTAGENFITDSLDTFAPCSQSDWEKIVVQFTGAEYADQTEIGAKGIMIVFEPT